MKSVRFAAVCVFLFASAGFGQVRTWVSHAGMDANPCTREQPCRNFAAAILAVAPGGEVVALDSAGYGPVLIDKSVTLVAPAGVQASIAPTSGTAISVGGDAHVVLRNLYLNSQGADTGIYADVATLYVERCVVSGFSFIGIRFTPIPSGARVFVSDTVVRRSGSIGIIVESVSAGVRATLNSVRVYESGEGIYVYNAEATIRDSVASGGGSGFFAYAGSKVMIENSISTGNGNGFRALLNAVMTVSRCAATSNTNGFFANGAGATIYVSESTIAANATGVAAASGGVVATRGDNTLQANDNPGAFNGNFTTN